MKRLLAIALLLGGCGYHLVGQGKATVIPEGVRTASLEAEQSAVAGRLLLAFKALWQGNTHLPPLRDEAADDAAHVTVRIEQASETFSPIGFDAAGLAVQYRLSMRGALRMYRQDALIWQAESIAVSADVFVGSNPSVIESERARLREQLEDDWARQAMARMQSGF